jgi:hypothetical protein
MKNEDIIREIKDVMAKLQGTSNLLLDGKIIVSYNRLFGINQKLAYLLKSMVESENENIKNKDI